MTYYRDRGGCFAAFVETVFVIGVLLIFAILALRLLMGLLPHGFW